VLRLGAAVDTVTLTHWAEYLARVPNKRRVRRRYERADSGEQWIEGLDDDGGIVDWEQGDYFPQILLDFLKAGQARTGPVGACIAELFSAKAFVAFAVEWMEARLTTRVI
jgi:aminoglycoside 3-N-acetyltransferase